MISKETAMNIYNCHSEIEKANQLFIILKDSISSSNKKELTDSDSRNSFQFGIPSSFESYRGHTLYNVNPELSLKVIEAHIDNKNKQLRELMVHAKIELKEVSNG